MVTMSVFRKKSAGAVDISAVMKEFRKTAIGRPLPREGACSFFYKSFSYAGQTIPLGSGKEYAFFHLEHDDVIQEILAGQPSIGIETGSERALISILFKTGATPNCIYLTFDLSREESRRILGSILARKIIEFNPLNMVYGEIVKEQPISIEVPAHILAEIKKAAG